MSYLRLAVLHPDRAALLAPYLLEAVNLAPKPRTTGTDHPVQPSSSASAPHKVPEPATPVAASATDYSPFAPACSYSSPGLRRDSCQYLIQTTSAG